MWFVEQYEHLVASHASPGQNPTTRRLRKDQTQLVSITFLDSDQPPAISTQSPTNGPVDVEVRHSSLRKEVLELWHNLQRHHQPLGRQSPSLLLKVFIAVENDEAQLGPSSPHLLEPGQIGDVIWIRRRRLFGRVERLHPSPVRT